MIPTLDLVLRLTVLLFDPLSCLFKTISSLLPQVHLNREPHILHDAYLANYTFIPDALLGNS